ncbi:hypothetical protein TTHERM_00711860 (macronuclear) [Tetrahymena thermophila SB210]|uniref:Uncharacterized protein n=1 Tax=Tetrahymena thermophila (strain SB210) TaxID=312017 RepID=Q24D07_TETTS|nr:hypothetical protein TTHERM_00711860 [Tetrahymena thermophila SB210]EAS05601.3 hypothetical protein TTHERM_00711860 [Tetrahymena thermophila SB210]|eukprot:XP_001025846.3 hypothetical protein TTHERM_00711860 [Tetrahymena thermophila SB210]
MICIKDFVQPTQQQRFKYTVVTVTEKFEKILDDVTKIRQIIYEKYLNEKADSKSWCLDSDLCSIKMALMNFSSQQQQEIIQFSYFLKDLLEEFEQLEQQQTLIKQSVPFQQRKFGMNLHLYNQMLKKRERLVKYFKQDEYVEEIY